MTKQLIMVVVLLIGLQCAGTCEPCVPSAKSCSTFELKSGGSIFVGHNLDDNYDVPGLVVVNKRGVRKQSFSWEGDLLPLLRNRRETRTTWVSRYGSLTYNTIGRDLPDGGMNEAGLYVGEMTLMSTVWPHDVKPSLYHYIWIQYLLDNYASVDQVVGSLPQVGVSGHNRWHFFVEDRRGDAAVIEFLDGKPLVYQHSDLPIKVLCNSSYTSELSKIRQFEGFGGDLHIDVDNKNVDNRFIWAAWMLQSYLAQRTDPVLYAFRMLSALNLGNNRWQIVFDLSHGTMYFCTEHAMMIRSVALADFDLGSGPAVFLDIHRDLEGTVSSQFEPLTDKVHRDYIRRATEPWQWHFDRDWTGLNTRFYPDLFRWRLFTYTKAFTSASAK